jgi:exonuclease VII small subunit
MRETKKKSKNKRDYNTRLKNLDHLPTNLEKTIFSIDKTLEVYINYKIFYY